MSFIAEIEKQARTDLQNLKVAADLENFRIAYLGKKGKVTVLMEHLKTLDGEARKSFGIEVNRLKQWIQEAIQERKAGLEDLTPQRVTLDPSLPSVIPGVGHLHPITQTIQEIGKIIGAPLVTPFRNCF